MNTEFFSNAIGAIDGVVFFIISFGAVFAGFIVCLFISIFKSGYGIKRRAWFLILLALFCALLRLRVNLLSVADYSPLLTVFGLILALPLYFIREKKKPKTDEKSVREFVRFIDGKIRVDNTEADRKPADSQTEVVNAVPREESKRVDIDFSHVKSVLERLEPATLSYADRKQIHELEVALYSAENGKTGDDTKTKINEGLGNLLKIMAKHGV